MHEFLTGRQVLVEHEDLATVLLAESQGRGHDALRDANDELIRTTERILGAQEVPPGLWKNKTWNEVFDHWGENRTHESKSLHPNIPEWKERDALVALMMGVSHAPNTLAHHGGEQKEPAAPVVG